MNSSKPPQAMTLRWHYNGKPGRFDIQTDEVVIGRSRSSDLILMVPSISRKHACLYFSQGRYFLKDLESSYGTKINGRTLPAYRAFPIKPGDHLEIGNLPLKFGHRDGNTLSEKNTFLASAPHFSSLSLSKQTEVFRQDLHRSLERASHGESLLPVKGDCDEALQRFSRFLNSRFREHQVLLEINQHLSGILIEKELLETALAHLARAIDADRGQVLFFDHRRQELLSAGQHRLDEEDHGVRIDRPFIDQLIDLVWRDRTFVFVTDALNDFREGDPLADLARGIRAAIGFPFPNPEDPMGVVYFDNLRSPSVFHEHQKPFLCGFANQLGTALQTARVYTQAVTDELTGLFNPKYGLVHLAKEMKRALRYRRKCGLLMIGIDDWDELSKRGGDQLCDEVLIMIAKLIRQSVRSTDLAIRGDRDQFTVLLPETEAEGAEAFAQRIQKRLSEKMVISDTGPEQLSLSIGIAMYDTDMHSDAPVFIDIANQALTVARENGQGTVYLLESDAFQIQSSDESGDAQ